MPTEDEPKFKTGANVHLIVQATIVEKWRMKPDYYLVELKGTEYFGLPLSTHAREDNMRPADYVEKLEAENGRYRKALEEIQRLLSGEGETQNTMAIITFAHVEANKALNPQESNNG